MNDTHLVSWEFFVKCFLPFVRLQRCPDVPPFPCWIWHGLINDEGYGVFPIPEETEFRRHNSTDPRMIGVARWALECALGCHLGELQALHRCDVHACVNPWHLYAGSALDNRNDQTERGARRPLLEAWEPFVRTRNVVRRPNPWTVPLPVDMPRPEGVYRFTDRYRVSA